LYSRNKKAPGKGKGPGFFSLHPIGEYPAGLNGNLNPILKGTVQGIPARIRILTKISIYPGSLSF
jgi:hypothetical protein